MGVEYFRIMEIDEPDQNGIVVALKDGELETFAGEVSPSQFGCGLDDDGNIRVDKGYFARTISRTKAEELKESYLNWKLQQGYVGPDPSAESVLANTPGTAEFSRRER